MITAKEVLLEQLHHAKHAIDTSIGELQNNLASITTKQKPSYKTLVATLGTTLAEWSYLFPEKFDDQHKEQARKNLKAAERVYKQALATLKKGTRT